jgi:hypothetical protein
MEVKRLSWSSQSFGVESLLSAVQGGRNAMLNRLVALCFTVPQNEFAFIEGHSHRSSTFLYKPRRITSCNPGMFLARVTVQSAVLFALLHLLHVVSPFAREALVWCSFPLATVVVLFAARYKAVESEAASMLLASTLALVITVPTILWLSH